jgi:hypothetical protein
LLRTGGAVFIVVWSFLTPVEGIEFNMIPRDGASPMLWEKLFQFDASLEIVTNCDCRATDAQPDADITPDWVMSASPVANEF